MDHSSANLLYVITDLELGGVPLHLHRLAVCMQARGYRPMVVSLAHPGPVGGMLTDDGVVVRTCAAQSRWDFGVIHRLAGIITGTKPAIVHSFLFHGNVAARLAAVESAFPACRVVCEVQTVEMDKSWHLTVNRWTQGLCRVTVGNSPSVTRDLVRRGGVPEDRVRLISGGIDVNQIASAVAVDFDSLGLPDDARVVLWVGRLDPVKGLELLVKAFSDVPVTTGAHLLLVGDGPMRNALVREIHQLGKTERIHLLGAREDVPSLLKVADVFAFPSRTEGLPNALLEAMAAGCAIVATDVPGCWDLIEHERNGLLVPYGDTSALTLALCRLLSDESTSRRLGAAACESARTRWSIERTMDGYVSLYREVGDLEL